MVEPHIGLRLDDEDRELLEAVSAFEKLSKSDVLRRALRAYALALGVAPGPAKRKKPKTKR